MNTVMINSSQGSVVLQTMLGWLAIHPPVANFLQWIYVPKIVEIGWQ